MNGFQCKFCNKIMAVNETTLQARNTAFQEFRSHNFWSDDKINIKFYKCPACEKTSIKIYGTGDQFPDGYNKWFYPDSNAKQFPEYVPEQIRADYEEAFKISELSPKASATLSRRCIQGMIRDVWDVKENNLYKEIDAIKDKIDATLWQAIDSLRQLGNIGAHTEKDINKIIDIDPNEATQLLSLVEILITEWYINPYERNLLLNQIVDINHDKQNLRKDS